MDNNKKPYRKLPDIYMDLRNEAGLSQTELANAINCNKQYVSKIEDGSRTLSINMLIKYADYFNVSVDYLLGRTDVKSTDPNIKQICEYTGLSEAAVNCLIRSKSENDKERRMMSLMIENPWMHSLVNSAAEVEYYAEKGIDFLDAYLSYRYSCQEMLTRLIDDILKEEGIFKEKKENQ